MKYNSSMHTKFDLIKGMKLLLIIFIVLSVSCPYFAFCAEITSKHENKSRLITLQDGVAMVLSDNRLIKISLSDNDMALQDSLVARSVLLPQLNLAATKHSIDIKIK